jgi:hypothetical protein
MAIAQKYDENRRGGFSLYGILSVAFVLVLSLLACRSIAIDTLDLTATGLDLAGFGVCHAIGAVLILRATLSRKLMADALILSLVLISYISIIVLTTSSHISILSFLGPRYGILNWLLLGMGAAAAASYIHLPSGSRHARLQRRLFVFVCLLVGALLSFLSLQYLSYPTFTLSYQSASDNLIFILLLFMIFTQVIWGSKVPIPVVLSFLAVGTLAVTAVARMQSTAIVGFWAVGLVVYFWSALSKLDFRYKVLAFATLAGASTTYLSSDLFTQTVESTRFATILTGGGLSSIDSRLDLLSDFGRQFAVSPIFGHFSAEIEAGSGLGRYPHTLLSFLTHTGLLGTTLVVILLIVIYSRRLPLRRLSSPDAQQFLFMSAILVLGTAYTFMTWAVFWFMLGFMCKRPTLRSPGEAR